MKTLNIEIPEGHEIDQENSNLAKGIVKFKKKDLSYESIAKKMFKKSVICISHTNKIINVDFSKDIATLAPNGNEFKSKDQLDSILALNKLCNVAKYLNGDWLPTKDSVKYCIYMTASGLLLAHDHTNINETNVFFETHELALQAMSILGEETIRKALTLNH